VAGNKKPLALVASALAIVYVVWGSTYLAIALAIRTLPPFLMGSARFLVAGALLYAWARRGRGYERPTLRHWRNATVIGGLLLLVGNGGVILGEKTVATGISALLIAAVPLWLALLDRVICGTRLSSTGLVGIVIGFVGVGLLVGAPGGSLDALGVAALIVAAIGWASGSLYARGASLPPNALQGAAMEMVGGGALMGIVGLATGEAGRVHPASISLESSLALVYLIVFGSLVAFSAYVWLLRAAPTSLVGTYAFVNPVVAVALGAAFLGEPVGLRTLAAGAVVVVAVALIVGGGSRRVERRVRAALPARAR
jgi:drug/metabolite transporter (DMT)-like permease